MVGVLCAFLYGLGRGALELFLPALDHWLGFVLFFPVLFLFAVLVGPDRRQVSQPDPALVPSKRVDIVLKRNN